MSLTRIRVRMTLAYLICMALDQVLCWAPKVVAISIADSSTPKDDSLRVFTRFFLSGGCFISFARSTVCLIRPPGVVPVNRKVWSLDNFSSESLPLSMGLAIFLFLGLSTDSLRHS